MARTRTSSGRRPVKRKESGAASRYSQMYAALSMTSEAILTAESAKDLYRGVCDAAVRGGGYAMAAVLIKTGDGSYDLRTVPLP